MRGGSDWGLLFIMSNLQVFRDNGSNITFSTENGVMVNATEMAKPFGKQAYDWLKTQSTNSKRIGRTLRLKGYERQHKRDGSWYLIAVKMC